MRVVAAAVLMLTLMVVSVPSSALECYACRMNRDIRGVVLAQHTLQKLAKFPTCDVMEKEGPSDKFKQTCAAYDRSCADIADPEDPTNRVRTCFILDKDECHNTVCYCTTDLCNTVGGQTLAFVAEVAVVALYVLGSYFLMV
ncbi:hypothetical protein FJT64_016740 [Amphibalanus amphitrite]|uniref:Protein sleepless n=1 Tax=Amphibalanus amphitrite TaxID=1232801 RepID=A0A6A4XDG2_AMPAM|nr:hypothetical protein FJT64_016740 [Amphibalanus amphitrite]